MRKGAEAGADALAGRAEEGDRRCFPVRLSTVALILCCSMGGVEVLDIVFCLEPWLRSLFVHVVCAHIARFTMYGLVALKINGLQVWVPHYRPRCLHSWCLNTPEAGEL